mgnify:FL=1
MKGSKKKLIFKNKKKRKTYKNRLKKRKTYKKRRYKRKTFKKKLVGGVNINLSDNDDSPQNIHIFTLINGTPMEITDNIVEYFKDAGFDEDDDDPNPPNFLQLQNVFKQGLKDGNSGTTSDQIDNLKIKVWTGEGSKPDKLVYTTGQGREGDRFLEADTNYVIIPDEDDDRIAAAITDPVRGILFGMEANDMYNQRVHEYFGSINPNQSTNQVEDAKVKVRQIKIKQLDAKIESLEKALSKTSKRNIKSRELMEKQLADLEIDRHIEIMQLPVEEEITPVMLRKSSSNASYDERGAAEDNTSRN